MKDSRQRGRVTVYLRAAAKKIMTPKPIIQNTLFYGDNLPILREELFAGKEIEMPPSAYGRFKQAEKIKKKDGTQMKLGEE
jgi:hypothetical protein